MAQKQSQTVEPGQPGHPQQPGSPGQDPGPGQPKPGQQPKPGEQPKPGQHPKPGDKPQPKAGIQPKLGVFQGSQPEIINTVGGVNLWRLTKPSVTVDPFKPVGPFPFTGLYSRVDQIIDLAVGAVVAYFDNWGMRVYEATISAIDPTTRTITVDAPNAPGTPFVLSYARADNSVGLPITILS